MNPHRAKFPRLILCLLLLGGFNAMGNAVVAAGNIQTPNPFVIQCPIQPRTFETISRLATTPWAGTPVPIPERIAGGAPASSQIALEIERAVSQIVACLNHGEPLRTWSLYTDRYVQEIIATQGGFDAELLQRMATPEPRFGDEQTLLRAVENVQVLADNRIRATVLLRPALIPVDKTFLFLLVKMDARWLLDDVVDELDLALP